MEFDASKLKKAEDCRGRIKEMVGDDGLIQLAKDGIIPHYVVKNPLTGEESFWFIASEINDWFNQNYIRYVNGFFTPKFEFLIFDPNNYAIGQEDVIPPELSKVQDLYKLPMEAINTPPGIYFLCKGSAIQYIGQAANVSARVFTHMNEGLKDFDQVYFITCPINRLNKLESALIRYYQPPYNRGLSKKTKGADVSIVESLFLEGDV